MSDERTTDTTDDEAATGPRHEADERTASDAGLTGDEGVQTSQPPPGEDGEDD
jgi:hypothetical protein